jgi:ADP-ribose pyrophosphatase YjhB (NUDIX family)
VAIAGDRVLLVRRGRAPGVGLWSVPGGRVEPGETVDAAVVREVAEETGLSVRCGPLAGWAERIGADHHYVILDFHVSVVGDTAPTAGDDAAEAAWVPVSELGERPLVDGLARFLASALSDPSRPAGASR